MAPRWIRSLSKDAVQATFKDIDEAFAASGKDAADKKAVRELENTDRRVAFVAVTACALKQLKGRCHQHPGSFVRGHAVRSSKAAKAELSPK